MGGATRSSALCLGRLGETARRLVDLKYAEGKKLAEIAAIVGWTTKAVKTGLHRARRPCAIAWPCEREMFKRWTSHSKISWSPIWTAS